MGGVIIHGVHRSGTSLTASLFAKAGCWFAEDELQMPVQDDNPRGFWERLDVVELNDEILACVGRTWFTLTPDLPIENIIELRAKFKERILRVLDRLEKHEHWFIKDPRMAITWPVWSPFIDEPKHLLVHRHPFAVASSLYSRNRIPLDHGLVFWYHQTRLIAQSLRDELSLVQLEFGSDQYFGGDSVRIVNEILGSARLKQNDLESLYDSNLVHHKNTEGEMTESFPEVSQAWNLAQTGDLAGILELPEIVVDGFTWDSLESRYAVDTQLKKASLEGGQYDREIDRISRHFEEKYHTQSVEIERQKGVNLGLESQLKSTHELAESLGARLNSATNQLASNAEKLHSTKQQLLFINDQLQSSNERLITIASNLQAFIFSRRQTIIRGVEKFFAWFGYTRSQILDDSLNIAKYQQDSDVLDNRLPKPSTRRVLLTTLVSRPRSFFKRVSLARIVKGIKIMFFGASNDHGLRQALTQYQDADNSESSQLSLYEEKNVDEWGERRIEFPKVDNPKVSIVIPVFNNYVTTLACLNSIYTHTDFDECSFEVVIADDCSSDETLEIAEWVTGIKVVRGSENLGFLGNCNQAIPKSRGRFVVLLNNDTNVQPGWLSELLLPLEADESIGVTGPKFVYPNGSLQEAGGIIFTDGSGWNYGRTDRSDKPEYSFARDVDYVSGACLVFKKTLWEKVGGFDTEFSPAYYEDTDFCFQTRKLGLRVRFIPTSVVVHFEGVSHGSSEDSGVKRYQAVNREKFARKWADTLKEEHFETPEDLFLARSHGKARKTLLFIDHHVPFYDKDAGSKVAQRYIELLVKQGVNVIFLGDNFYPHQPYTEELQKLGVEVLHGEYYKNHWYDWLKENTRHIDVIYLNRPHISQKYIDKILALKKVPFLAYHGADLHYVRTEREEALGVSLGGLSSKEWKDIEFDLMRKCDVSLWLSENEVRHLQAEDSSLNVAYKPMYWFDQAALMADRALVRDKAILFVGSFGHPPNLDGLKWFLQEVFPSIIVAHPDVLLTIIGSGCPDEILQLDCKNIHVKGFVSEAELSESYATSRVSLVPLRYGAGVKGKVIESMHHGVAVLTTPIGAEGLPGEPLDYLTVADSRDDFARELLLLLDNDDFCQSKVSKSRQALLDYFSVDSALNSLSKILGEKA